LQQSMSPRLAEETRAIAVQMSDVHNKATMLGIAQNYEKLAQRAEQRALKPLQLFYGPDHPPSCRGAGQAGATMILTKQRSPIR
jgi:hypothetical protein